MRRATLLLATCALLASGCGSSDDPGKSNEASGPAEKSDTGAGATVKVSMQGIAFSPKKVTAKVGQTIEWDNKDSVEHNVVAKDGADFKSGLYGKGESFSTKVGTPGTIKYECTVHPGMVGEIVVR